MENLEAFCRKWLLAWTGNQPEHLRSFYTLDAYYRDPYQAAGISGEQLLPYFKKLLKLNPSWTWEAIEIIPTAQGACVKWQATIPVGNQIIHETGLDIVEIKEGRICRNEVYFDRTAWLKAVNLTPS